MQEVNYILINTRSLIEKFRAYSDNLAIEDEGLHLDYVSISGKDVPLKVSDKPDSFKGTYVSTRIDSQNPKTRWHRFLLEGDFKEDTNIQFLYYISNDENLTVDQILDNQWYKGIYGASSKQGKKRRDALFQEDVQGRYFWFKIIFLGTENVSPVIRSITIFFPRVSFLDYLPAIYKEDPVNRRFLERFLSIFESEFFEIEFDIDHLSRFFDAYGTPPEFVSWLGSWLAISIDKDWTEDKKKRLEDKRRRFIQNAISLYKKRGTRTGLEDTVELYTGYRPLIVENFHYNHLLRDEVYNNFQEEDVIFFPSRKAKTMPNNGEFIINKDKVSVFDSLFGAERFSFLVLLTEPNIDDDTLGTIRDIIEDQKPAHTSYGIHVIKPEFCLDKHTYLGMNTVLK